MLPDYARKAVVGTVSAIDITKDVYVVSPVSPVTTGAKAHSPPVHRKGKLVFFQHGLGADWREFATTISGTSVGHRSQENLEDTENKKYGLKQKVDGLVQISKGEFCDAGVISNRGTTNFSSKDNEHCSHSCNIFNENYICDMLKMGKVVCIKTEFSSGSETFENQLFEMKTMVELVEKNISAKINDKTFEYDVAFVGHSMGGISSIDYGIDYAKRNPNRYVDIITVSTPYYENFMAKIEAPMPFGFLFRGNNGAADDLAGNNVNLLGVMTKWNEHITSPDGKKTSLSAIGIEAEGRDAYIAHLDKEIREYEEKEKTKTKERMPKSRQYYETQGKKQLTYNQNLALRNKLLEGYGSDYVVPTNVQLAIIPNNIDLEIKKIQNVIVKKGYLNFLAEYQEHLSYLDTIIEKNKELSRQTKFENEKVLYDKEIKKLEETFKEVIKEKEIILRHKFLKEYQTVNRLPIINKNHFQGSYFNQGSILKAGDFEDDYHHVNTPDLPEVILYIESLLKNIKKF